jgi:hypothetical protein
MATLNPSARLTWLRYPIFRFFASVKLAVVLLAVLIVAAIAGTIYECRTGPDAAFTSTAPGLICGSYCRRTHVSPFRVLCKKHRRIFGHASVLSRC